MNFMHEAVKKLPEVVQEEETKAASYLEGSSDDD